MKELQANIIALPAEVNIIDVIIDNLVPDGSDYSKNIIIFPNKRPAHFLRKKLAIKIGTSFIPPYIFSIDEFIDYLYELDSKDMKLDSIDAVRILYELHKESQNKVGGNAFIDIDSFFPLGLKIYHDIEEMYIEKISLHEVKNIEHLLEGIPFETYSRLQGLSYFYEHFYGKIAGLGYSTRSLRYRTAPHKISRMPLESLERIILSGFFALTRAEIDLFRVILSKNNSLLVFKDGPGIEEKLKDLGIDFRSSFEYNRDTEISFYSCPDAHGQIFGLSRLLKKRIDEGDEFDERNVIVIPSSDNIFPLLHQCLSLLKPDLYNISMGYPIYRTPIFTFFNNLIELILSINDNKFYIPDYLKFVLHPYIKNIYLSNQPELTRIIFHTIEEEFSQNSTISFLSLEEIESNQKILVHLEGLGIEISKETVSNHLHEIHENTINKFISFKNIEDFANKCKEILIYIYNNSTAQLHPLFYPFSEAFLLAFERISSSLIKDLSFPSVRGYFSFFKKYILTCKSPFEGAPLKGLQVLGFLESRNLSFENLYILDFNEDILPATQKDTSLIPFAIRKSLGLPTYIDSDKISEYYFEILIRGAKRAHLFFIENDQKEKSRFIERIIWEKQKKDYSKNINNYIKSIQYKVTLRNIPPKEILKTESIMAVLEDFTFTTSSLDTYLKCGLAFYYNYVLSLQKRRDITGEIERSDLGIFLHDLLFRYFKDLRGQLLDEQNLSIRKMEYILSKLFEEKFGKNLFGSAYLIKLQLKSHINELIKNYYIPLSKESAIKINHCNQLIKVGINSHNLKGIIDSIEERDKKIIIIDYKSSSSEKYYKINFDKLDIDNRSSWQKAIGSLQLPFYMLLYLTSTKTNLSNLDAMFLLLGKNKITKNIELPFCDSKEHKEENYKKIEEVIFRLINEIKDINTPFMPPLDMKNTCLFCDYKNICGTFAA